MLWKKLGKLKLESGKLWIGDMQFIPETENFPVVDLPVGEYKVSVKPVIGDGRASRMRVVLDGAKPKRGGVIGETWADTGSQGVADLEIANRAHSVNQQEFQDEVMDGFERDATGELRIKTGDAQAVMIWCWTAEGDGDFQVHELTQDGIRCGIEIVFA